MQSTIKESDLNFHERVGFGSYGIVYRVTLKSEQFGEVEAAAKQIQIQEYKSPEEQCGLEIDILKELDHVNVIKYYGHIITPTCVTVVTEYAAKGSLYDYLQKVSRLSSAVIRKWALQAAKAIQHLRKAGLVHRDIKSPNFLISSSDTLKVCDFGLAKNLTSTRSTHSEKGTIPWLAPEVFVEEKLSPKTDIFAFGIMLWELITCEEPYKGMFSARIMLKVGTSGLRPEIPRDCPQGYAKLMQQCWDRDRSNRPVIDDVVALLENPDDSFSFPPGPPRNINVSTITSNEMTVSWDTPEDDGGSPVTGYIVEYKSISTNTWTRTSPDLLIQRKFTVSGLIWVTEYHFRVTAENKAGKRKISEPTESYTCSIGSWKETKNFRHVGRGRDICEVRCLEACYDGNVIVTDTKGACVYVYDENGEKKLAFKTQNKSKKSKKTKPWQVVRNAIGTLYFVTDWTKYVKVFNAEGVFQRYFVVVHTSDRTLLSGLAKDSKGHLLVGECVNMFISKYTEDGVHLGNIKVSIPPRTLAVTSLDTIIINSVSPHPVQVVDQTGTLLYNINAPPGITDWWPEGISSIKDTILIANCVDELKGGGIYCYTLTGVYMGRIPKEVSVPYSLAVSKNGNEITGCYFDRIRVFVRIPHPPEA